jgi:hypothetical protein
MSIDIRDRTEARRIRLLRQGWQADAFAYAKSIPEVSFAYRFLANSAKRMRVMPMAVNPDEPDGAPITLREAGFPAQVIDSCDQAMGTLGVGRISKSPMLEALSRGLGIPGECWLVGTTDEETGEETWAVRSIAELMVMEDEYKLREIPLDPQGTMGWVTLDPANTYIARMWVPDTEFRILADSPMRALLDTCEELLLLGRDVRAIARSRIAGAGLLKVPNELSIQSYSEDNRDPMSDDFLGRLGEMMMVPIAEEGVASSVVPGIVRGEPEALAQLQHVVMDRPYSALAMELRSEAIGRLANGLDVPRAIVLGTQDVNHWGAWQISEDTFRHHIEPGIIADVDALTQAFLRPWLETDNIDPYWVDRALMWYDPVELITHPDRTSDALAVHQRLAISDRALRTLTGFDDTDAPTAQEIELRMIRSQRTFPPNVIEALFHILDPDLAIPAMTGKLPAVAPAAPGTEGALEGPEAIQPESDPGLPPASPPAALPPAIPEVTATPTAARDSAAFAATQRRQAATFAAKRAADRQRQRLSRKLTEIDSNLRARVHTAACASMVRILEKAGAKLRTTANSRKYKNGVTSAAIDGVPAAFVAQKLGPSVVAAMGFPDAYSLLATDWADLKPQFYEWVTAAQRSAVVTAAQLAGLPPTAPIIRHTLNRLSEHLDDAWFALTEALTKQAESLLYNPMPNAPNPDEIELNPATVVPVGIIRRVLGIAGGSGKPTALRAADYPSHLVGENAIPGGDPWAVDPTQLQPGAVGPGYPMLPVTNEGETGAQADPAAVAVELGMIGTGSDVTDMLTSSDMQVETYTWEHNYAGNFPLEGHLNLDGVQFTSFTDDVLANPDSFPDVEFYLPGDHDGCVCDYVSEWGVAEEAVQENLAIEEGGGLGMGEVPEIPPEGPDVPPWEAEGMSFDEWAAEQSAAEGSEYSGMSLNEISDQFAAERAAAEDAIISPSTDWNLAQSMESGVRDEFDIGSGSGAFNLGVQEEVFNDGTMGIIKQVDTQDMVDREVLASTVGKAIGAPTVEAIDVSSGNAFAVERRFLPPTFAEDATRSDVGHAIASDAGARLGVFDLLVDNTDGHMGNWVIDVATGNPVSFDLGFTFDYARTGMVDSGGNVFGAGRPLRSSFASTWAQVVEGTTSTGTNAVGLSSKLYTGIEDITKTQMTQADIVALRDALHSTQDAFTAAGHPDWYEAMIERFETMANAAQDPMSGRNLFVGN